MKPLTALLPLFAMATFATLAAPNPDLAGTVLTDTGAALTNATIFIYTAGPKVGVGTL